MSNIVDLGEEKRRRQAEEEAEGMAVNISAADCLVDAVLDMMTQQGEDTTLASIDMDKLRFQKLWTRLECKCRSPKFNLFRSANSQVTIIRCAGCKQRLVIDGVVQ